MLSEEELLAERVLDAFGIKRVPVNVFEIARKERIELCPTAADASFCGRLEFHPSVNRFFLFYPEGVALDNGRLRFSVAHELAHYNIARHQELLRSGTTPHSSEVGFICETPMEREADDFAAGLLIPKWELERRLATREYLTLREIGTLAADCQTSLESAAIRYAKFATDRSVVVVSRRGQICYSIPSDGAVMFWRRPARGTSVPPGSISANPPTLYEDGAETSIADWSPGSFFKGEVWEEAIRVGYGATITLLALQAKTSR